MSIAEVAKRASVSIATVSRVINNTGRVDPETAARVRTAIDELGYVPNSTAKALVSGRSNILGIVVSDITNPFFPDMIQAFEGIAIENGYDILTVSSHYDPGRMEQCIHRLLQRSVDGVAIITSEFDPAVIGRLTQLRVPTVYLDMGVVGKFVSNIRVDYESGIRQAVAHLVGLGHQRIAFISGPAKLKSAIIRKQAFLRSLQEASLSDDLVVEGNHAIDGGLDAMAQLIEKRPSAVLCSNDLTAIGAMRAIRRAGLSVPHDISVVGFDDIQLSRFTEPPLTTVRLPRVDLAVAAFQALLYTQNNERQQGIEKNVETTLVVRESTAPAVETIRSKY